MDYDANDAKARASAGPLRVAGAMGDTPASPSPHASVPPAGAADNAATKPAAGPDPAGAAAQIAALQGDEAFMKAYLNGAHPGHAEAVQRMQGLFDARFGSETQSLEKTGMHGERVSVEALRPALDDPAAAAFEPVTTPADYVFQRTQLVWNDEGEQEARELFVDAGLPQGVASLVVSRWNAHAGNAHRNIEGQTAETERVLREEWGDQFDAKMKAARSFAKSPRAKELMNASGLGSDVHVIRALANLAQARAG